MKININCGYLLERLENAGFQAYLVGGCVRDMLLGRPFNDFDITTNALPEQVCGVFSDLRVIPTGLKHGTVTVLYKGVPYEITTFRIDGSYSDSRRPDAVTFSASLEEDLKRRDFTVNAIAADRNGTIYDPFGGASDIGTRTLRCVGDPRKRFSEDALRILRAVRFASVLGFDIEDNTRTAVMELRGDLSLISRERCRCELQKMLMGDNFVKAALEYRDVIAEVVPEFRPCFDFDQRSRYHRYNIYEHIIRATASAPKDLTLRTAMFFHDIGKPDMFTLDDKGFGHFKGHAGVSADITRNIMKRLRWDTHTIEQVCKIIACHSDSINTEKQARLMALRLGRESFFMLIEAKKADNMAKQPFVLEENVLFDSLAEKVREAYDNGECLSMGQLAVNGSDIASLGVHGKDIGRCLDALLELTAEGSLPNDREVLLTYAREELI